MLCVCEICKKINNSTYASKLSQYMLEDIERMMRTDNELMFSQTDFPYIEPLIYLEPRVAMPKPTRYYQEVEIDERKLRLDWSSGSMRAIGLKDDSIVFITKSVIKKTGEPERLNYYFMVNLKKDEITVEEKNNEIIISFNGKVDGINIKNRKMEQHNLKFAFIHQHNEKAIVPKSRISSSRIYNKSRGRSGRAIRSRAEEYTITVMHFAPHPLLMQSYKELGFESQIELQKKVYDILIQHLL